MCLCFHWLILSFIHCWKIKSSFWFSLYLQSLALCCKPQTWVPEMPPILRSPFLYLPACGSISHYLSVKMCPLRCVSTVLKLLLTLSLMHLRSRAVVLEKVWGPQPLAGLWGQNCFKNNTTLWFAFFILILSQETSRGYMTCDIATDARRK